MYQPEYIHERDFIHDKQILKQAVKNEFIQPLFGMVKIVIDEYGKDDILLTQSQLEQLRQEHSIMISCHKGQIMNYAHSCISTEKYYPSKILYYYILH